MHAPSFARLVAAALVALASACASTSYPYHFDPSPADVLVEAAPGGPPVARVLVGVVGAEREGKRRDGHPDLIVRVRVEAKGPAPVRFVPASTLVLGPDLAQFGPARVVAEPGTSVGADGELEVPQGEARDVTLRFAFPRDGDLRMPRLTGVNVSLKLDTPAGAREVSVSLSRNEYERVRRDAFGDPGPWHWHFGYFYSSDC